MAKRTNRVAWGLVVVLAGVVLVGGGWLIRAVLRQPYIVARYRGHQAILTGVALPGANLQGADLRGADLQRANLKETNLRGANLTGADLYGASLTKADLRGANLLNSELSRTDLRGADLSGANLRNLDMHLAIYDDRTRWPQGFDPQSFGAVKKK